jgi:signal transduction histidine kinase
MAARDMGETVGTWDYDRETGLLQIGPEGTALGTLRIPGQEQAPSQLVQFVHPADLESLSRRLSTWIGGGAPGPLRFVFRVGNAVSGWFWIEITGRRDAVGNLFSGVWADVSVEKAARLRQEEAVSRVHQFAAAASHDLIGPLRHIAMYGDMLIEDFGTGATEEKRKMLQAMADKARSLQILTKRLIAFSTDTSAPESIAVPIERTIDNVRARLAAEIEAADARVSARLLPVVVGDPVLMEKVFENLLRNALEWRGNRQPAIRIEGRAEGRSAWITVTDNGCGIDPRYATRIFDAFWSMPKPGGEKGAGLGLAVCKTIILALGGEMTLVSSTPEGSIFEIRLPRAR